MAQEPLPSVTERLVQLGQTELLTNIPFRQCLADFVGVNLNPTTRTWLQGQGRLTSENRVRVAVFLEGLNKPARDLANLEPGLRIVANAFAFELLSAQKLMEALQCNRYTVQRLLTSRSNPSRKGQETISRLADELKSRVEEKKKDLQHRLSEFRQHETDLLTNGSALKPTKTPELLSATLLVEVFASQVAAMLPLAEALQSAGSNSGLRRLARELSEYRIKELADVLYSLSSEKSLEMTRKDAERREDNAPKHS